MLCACDAPCLSQNRNKLTGTHLGKIFGPILFFGAEPNHPENAAAANIVYFLLSEARKGVNTVPSVCHVPIFCVLYVTRYHCAMK